MKNIILKLQDDPIRIFLIIVIIACLVGLISAVKNTYRLWKAWRSEAQKKRPPIRYPIHFDKKV